MTRQETFNFAAGPSYMPDPVMERAQREMLNYGSSGMSIMEMSHRSSLFQSVHESAKAKLKALMQVPDTHEILFLQGGATLQFAAIPMNLMDGGEADYAITGNFSGKAAREAEKYGRVNVIYDTSSTGHDRIPTQSELNFTEGARYFYYCANNTAFGTEWQYTPRCGAKLVSDMSSDILTRPVDFSKYALVYAGAQKNMSPAGLTVAIIDKSFAGRAYPYTPEVMRYDVLIKNDSMLNTPPCWCIYMLGLMLDWIEENGGIPGMEERKIQRSKPVYEYLDNSRLFIPHAKQGSRSFMNVTFSTGNEALDSEFIAGAEKRGMLNLKGYKTAGGMRASLYNAMPMEGVNALLNYMKEFEKSHV